MLHVNIIAGKIGLIILFNIVHFILDLDRNN